MTFQVALGGLVTGAAQLLHGLYQLLLSRNTRIAGDKS
jgi:hypothetical protein